MTPIAYCLVTEGFGGGECYLLMLLRALDRAAYEPIVLFRSSVRVLDAVFALYGLKSQEKPGCRTT